MALLLASTKKASSSSSADFLIFLVLIAVVGYFLLIRPQKQKQRRQREQQSAVSVGDEVLTVGGIVGRVIAVDADRVTILSGGDTVGFPAVGNEPTRIVLVRNAIARKIEPTTPTEPDEDASDDEGEEDAHEDAVASNGAGEYAMNGDANEGPGHETTGALPGAEGEGAGS
jgi:preprotein translocase subunit YajC